MPTNTSSRNSELRYANSDEDVRLGDRVEFQSIFFRRRRLGTVVCIPEMSGRERAKLGEHPENWLIKLDSGVITGWLYSPEDLQPPRRLRLLERAHGEVETLMNEQLEAMERAEEENASWLELAAPLVFLAAIMGAFLALAVWLF